jgi:hypothetical protein
MVQLLPKRKTDNAEWGGSDSDGKTLEQFRKLLNRADDKDMKVLLFMGQEMAG